MAEPFVFHFSRGTDGHPRQMYLADVRAECTLCGHPQLQRYYHAAGMHAVTTQKLVTLASAVPGKTAYDCPNCGTAVGLEGCVDASFTWAFPDDAGLLRAFVKPDGDMQWQLVPGRRLDPQELPGWQPNLELEGVVREELDDEVIEETLLRPLNPKLVIREVLEDWREDPEGGAVTEICPGMTLLVAGPDLTLDELREEAGGGPGVVAISLEDCVPHDLPTHRHPQQMSGRLSSWLPDETALPQVEFLLSSDVAVQSVERAFSVANLSYELEGDGAERIFANVRTPRNAEYPRALPVMSMLRRSVYTGLTPGDAARLTAEEIVGTLLRVW